MNCGSGWDGVGQYPRCILARIASQTIPATQINGNVLASATEAYKRLCSEIIVGGRSFLGSQVDAAISIFDEDDIIDFPFTG